LGAQYLWVAVDVRDFKAGVVEDSLWRDLHIDFRLTEPAFCEMEVLDSFGRTVTNISTRRRFPVGDGHMSWSMLIPQSPTAKIQPTKLPQDYSPGKLLPQGVKGEISRHLLIARALPAGSKGWFPG
jgi:hypothetical protein